MTPSLADQTLATNFTALPSTPASSAASLSTQVSFGQAGGSSSTYLTSTLPPTTLAGPSYHTAQNQTLTVVSAERDSAVIPPPTNSSLPPPPHSTVVTPPTTSVTLSIMPFHMTSSLPAQSSHSEGYSTVTLSTAKDPLSSINPKVAGEAFREHRADLLIAITDPLILANSLYSKRIISRETLERVMLQSFTKSEKNSIVLGAIEDRIGTHSSDFHTLLALLLSDSHLCVFAERIQDSYSEFLSIMF